MGSGSKRSGEVEFIGKGGKRRRCEKCPKSIHKVPTVAKTTGNPARCPEWFLRDDNAPWTR
jgi:hypothetical protein